MFGDHNFIMSAKEQRGKASMYVDRKKKVDAQSLR